MRYNYVTATLAAVAGVNAIALPQQAPGGSLAKALNPDDYKSGPMPIKPVPLAVAASKFANATGQVLDEVKSIIGNIIPVPTGSPTASVGPLPTNLASTLTTIIPRDGAHVARGSCQNPPRPC